MKLLNTIIALFITAFFYAQEFKITNDFKISDFKSQLNATKNNNDKEIAVYLYKDDEPLAKLINLDKNDLDFFMDVTVKVLENPNLENTKQIIKVEFEFMGCCSNYESLYFVQTNDNELIKLPQLDYIHCEYATDKMEYIFPSQKFGQANVILTTESYLDSNQNTETVKVVNTTVWEEQNAVEEYSYNYND